MRLLYVTESMGWSGGAQQVLWMAGALRARGHTLILACQPGSDIAARAQAADIPVEYLRMRQDYDLFAVWNLRALIHKHRIEILHAQHSTAHAIALMAAALSGVPVLAVTRRVVFPLKSHLFSRLKYLSGRINGYIAISEAVKAQLTKAGVKPEGIEVIPSVSSQPQATSRERAEVRKELGLSADGPVVIHVANYAEFKGQRYLARAAVEVLKQVPKVRFLFVGRDTEKMKPLVSELGIESSVRLTGFRTDIPRLLGASDIFAFPSLQEAAGTALREAMAAGLPCIGSRTGGIAETLQDGVTGLLVEPANPSALAAALLRLLKNPEEARALAQTGKTFVEKNYSLQNASERMERFYERLLAAFAKTSPHP